MAGHRDKIGRYPRRILGIYTGSEFDLAGFDIKPSHFHDAADPVGFTFVKET